MTTFTSEDVASLLTDWFPGNVEPVTDGEYDVETEHWPWPHRAMWTNETGWDVHEPVVQWRGLRVRIPQ